MQRYKDITGQKFGLLTAIEYVGNDPKQQVAMWECECECKQRVIVRGSFLRNGHTQSCGCKSPYMNMAIKDGKETPTYNSWRSMIQRCTNPKASGYEYYGGRGIKIVPDWFHYGNFLKDMGVRPDGMTLDRISTNGMYSPDNCKWSTATEQNQNKRNCLNYKEIHNETTC